MKKNYQETKQKRQQGVGLVEVMIALLIFSVGMLGVASLQVLSKKSSYEAQQRQEAVLLANEIVSRMKNSGASFIDLQTNYNGKSASDDGAVNASCQNTTATCAADDMASHNLFVWEQSLKAKAVDDGDVPGLIGAKGCVEVVSAVSASPGPPAVLAAPALVTVTVSWLSMTKFGANRNEELPTDCKFTDADDIKKVRHVKIKTYL